MKSFDMKKYKVIAMHCYPECDMKPRCSFCYKSKGGDIKEIRTKPEKFWLDLVPYLKQLTNQIAVGGGEPFMKTPFIKKLAEECKKNKLIMNVTSNGKLLMGLSNKELKGALENIAMISLSFDREKVKNRLDLFNYSELVRVIKKHTNCQVGCNLLINKEMFENKGVPFLKMVYYLFKGIGVDRIFALYPKNAYFVDILKYKKVYQYLSMQFEKFYIDDLTKMILENGYRNWKKPCHFAKDLVSISETGAVCGCSFDCDEKALLKLDKPSDLLKLKDIKTKLRMSCPYLKEKD